MYHRRTGHIPGRDHATADGPASGRAIVLFGLFFLMTGCLLFLQACDTVEATKERENMEITKGIVTKITTTKDQCVRLTVDIDKSFIPEEVNILKWQDQEVVLQGGDNDRG